MVIKFVKIQNEWFADLPEYLEHGGNFADCQMVAGADDWLEMLAQGEEEVFLTLSVAPLEERLDIVEQPNDPSMGATYTIKSYKGVKYNHQLWLCPVTLWVFGHYPETIYYQ